MLTWNALQRKLSLPSCVYGIFNSSMNYGFVIRVKVAHEETAPTPH